MSPVKLNKRKIRHIRVRKKISGTSEYPRLSVFRSNKFIYAQIIDDEANKTIMSPVAVKIKMCRLIRQKISQD